MKSSTSYLDFSKVDLDSLAELMLLRRSEQLFEQLYAQPDFHFLKCWKEIDATSTGYLTANNIQVFFTNIGIVHPHIHEWLFRRFPPYTRKKIDINDFRRLFDCLGQGILGEDLNSSEYGEIV